MPGRVPYLLLAAACLVTLAVVWISRARWYAATLRPRLLTWLRNLTDAAERTGALPRLSALARSLHGELSRR